MIGTTNAPFSVGKSFNFVAASSWSGLTDISGDLDAIGVILKEEELSTFSEERCAIRTSLPDLTNPEESSSISAGYVIILAGNVGGFKDHTLKLFTNKDMYANLIGAYICREVDGVLKFEYVDAGLKIDDTWKPFRKYIYFSSLIEGMPLASVAVDKLLDGDKLLNSEAAMLKTMSGSPNNAIYSDPIEMGNGRYNKVCLLRQHKAASFFTVFGLSLNTKSGKIKADSGAISTDDGPYFYKTEAKKYYITYTPTKANGLMNLGTDEVDISDVPSGSYRLKLNMFLANNTINTVIYGMWLE